MKKNSLTHLVIPINHKTPFLKEIFHNEVNYPFLNKVYDSEKNQFENKIKIFEINYKLFKDGN